jgi:alginate O-acetyltransferase complex protein AlgI
MALIPLAVLKNVQENAPGFTMAKMIPVGISYFSFRCAAYLIEIRRGTIATVGFWRLLHYAFFWPTLFAGPIERPGPFFEQSEKMERPSRDDRILGLYRMMIGFLKKTVLAGIFAAVARPFLGLGADFTTRFEAISAPHLWLCVIAYYLYLYLDFSAYSDLAIGASRLLGFRIMENFRWPILATNISEFWQRWHISLTSWVTDYIYRPLGGSRNGLAKAARYSMIAMVIIGAWHGMNPHFIVWGAFHAVFLTLYRYWRKVWQPKFFPDGKPGPAWLRTSLAWLLTHVIVSLGWVLFNFPVGQSLRIWAKMFGLS